MNIQTPEKLLKQLYEAIARYAGQLAPAESSMEECRLYAPVKNDHPVQRREKRSDYYR